MPAELRVSEIRLAEVSGVERSRIREVRKRELVEGSDWGRGDRGQVLLTVWAAKKALAEMGVEEAPAILRELEVEWRTPLLRADLVVTRQQKNPRVVRARLEGLVGEVDLRVPRSANFTPGLRVPGCVQVRPGLWDFVGRCPRWRGTW